jgi:hypothetical protein
MGVGVQGECDVDGAALLAFVQEGLVSQLQLGQVVVLDNLQARSGDGTMSHVGALLAARFSFMPNRLGYCGPEENRAMLDYLAEGYSFFGRAPG